MSKKKTKFTKEFKLQAIKLVTKEGYTQAEAAKNLGIDAKNLSRWVQECRSRKQVSQGANRLSGPDQEELHELRKEVKRLKMERDMAKIDVIDYIEMFYNSRRLYSTLGYMSPAQFENEFLLKNLSSFT